MNEKTGATLGELVLPMRERGVVVVSAPYYADVATMLLEGSQRALEKASCPVAGVLYVPGALEIAPAISLLIKADQLDLGRFRRLMGVVILGCVIRGETSHYDIVCEESARQIGIVTLSAGLPMGFGLLTCETHDQALRRADPSDLDRGGDAARACLRLIDINEQLRG